MPNDPQHGRLKPIRANDKAHLYHTVLALTRAKDVLAKLGAPNAHIADVEQAKTMLADYYTRVKVIVQTISGEEEA